MFHFKKKQKKTYPEQTEQIKFFEYLGWKHKNYVDVCFSIPNEGKRTYVQLAQLVKAGLTSGVPDVFCAIPNKKHPGMFIEFKHGDNKLSPSQARIIPRLKEMGYQCEVCYSADEAIIIFDEYMSNV